MANSTTIAIQGLHTHIPYMPMYLHLYRAFCSIGPHVGCRRNRKGRLILYCLSPSRAVYHPISPQPNPTQPAAGRRVTWSITRKSLIREHDNVSHWVSDRDWALATPHLCVCAIGQGRGTKGRMGPFSSKCAFQVLVLDIAIEGAVGHISHIPQRERMRGGGGWDHAGQRVDKSNFL